MTLGPVRPLGAYSPWVCLPCSGERAAALHQRAIKGEGSRKREKGGADSQGFLWALALGGSLFSFLVYPCPFEDILAQFIFWARESELLVSNNINLNKEKEMGQGKHFLFFNF